MTRALIVGSEGQDGRILFERLAADGVSIVGLGRNSARCTEPEDIAPVDVGSRSKVASLMEKWRPDEIYYLASTHQTSQDPLAADDALLFEESLRVHVRGVVNFLETIRELQPETRLFFAASSLIFGVAATEPQDERTPFQPRCIYGITKTAGLHACRFYRETHRLHASAGILYNHESPLRKPDFVSRKIVRSAVAIAHGSRDNLVVGDLSARIDWGYAPDFIEAMVRIARHPQPDEYIVATGEAHTVQEFAEIAFERMNLDWRDHVKEDPTLLTRRSTTHVGNAKRLRERTGWRPQVTFTEMVHILVDAEKRDAA